MFRHLRVLDFRDKIHRVPVEAAWVPNTQAYIAEFDVIDPKPRGSALGRPS